MSIDISTFDDDLLGLKPFAERLEAFIDVEHNFVKGGLVVALSAKFGSGKTTFLEMWKNDIENRVRDEEKGLLVVSLNAWESDYLGDPLFAIVSALVEGLRDDAQDPNKIIEAAKDVGSYTLAIGNQVAKKFSGVDAAAAGEVAKKKKATRSKSFQISEDTFSVFQGRKESMAELKEAITARVASSEPRVLFLVDELDRCRPDYALAYLETIKHIFDIRGAVFVLAADRRSLENSAKAAFGRGLDFDEYYRKFIHREVSLPQISAEGYQSLSNEYVDYFLNRAGVRFCYMRLEATRERNVRELVGALRMTPRQLQEFFRLLGHLVQTSEDTNGKLAWSLAAGSILMTAFKVAAPMVYERLGTSEMDPEAAFEILSKLDGLERIDWWYTLLATGGGIKFGEDREGSQILASLKQLGLVSEGVEQIPNFNQWYEGWGFTLRARIPEIFEKLEQISSWN